KIAEEKYTYNISKQPFCLEKGFLFQDAPFMHYSKAVSSIVEKHGWQIFCLHPNNILTK
ncbi:hypothetical protein J1N35_011478, partial [Gossypium stocksii]